MSLLLPPLALSRSAESRCQHNIGKVSFYRSVRADYIGRHGPEGTRNSQAVTAGPLMNLKFCLFSNLIKLKLHLINLKPRPELSVPRCRGVPAQAGGGGGLRGVQLNGDHEPGLSEPPAGRVAASNRHGPRGWRCRIEYGWRCRLTLSTLLPCFIEGPLTQNLNSRQSPVRAGRFQVQLIATTYFGSWQAHISSVHRN